MNQKYLCGISTDINDNESLTYFEATPENIASYLYEHRHDPETTVCAVDGKLFLTAKTGLVDTIPDQEYWINRLQPAYLLLTEEKKVPNLKTVPQETAEAETCPMPDWNFLRWTGYSDEKYKSILDGSGLFDWELYGKTYRVELRVKSYVDHCNLAIELIDWTEEDPEPWGILTVNLDGKRDKDCAFIDINNLQQAISWLEKNELAVPTGRIMQSGYVFYPEYHFHRDKLMEIDPEGYEGYSQRFDTMRAKKHRNGQER